MVNVSPSESASGDGRGVHKSHEPAAEDVERHSGYRADDSGPDKPGHGATDFPALRGKQRHRRHRNTGQSCQQSERAEACEFCVGGAFRLVHPQPAAFNHADVCGTHKRPRPAAEDAQNATERQEPSSGAQCGSTV